MSYVDYGNTDVVSSLDVAALPESFMSVPALGVMCSLEGVGQGFGRMNPHFLLNISDRESFSHYRHGEEFGVCIVVMEGLVISSFLSCRVCQQTIRPLSWYSC